METHVWRSRERPLLYAHRGGNVEWPENSIEAFRSALDAGADVLETDVHLSSDGHVVIAHDATGLRVAGVDREIRQSTLRELKRWDLAAGGARKSGGRRIAVPTLDEVLSELPHAALNIDIKQREPDMTAPLIETLERHAASERVLLTSFDARVLQRVRGRHRGPTGLAQSEAFSAVLAPAWWLRSFGLPGVRLQVPPRHGPIRLDRASLIRKMHTLGVAVDYWVINRPDQAAELLALGADGIVTDDPRAMAALFAGSPFAAGWRARHARLVEAHR